MSNKEFDVDAWLCSGCEFLKFNDSKRFDDCHKCLIVAIKDAFAAGRAHQAKVDMEAVEKLEVVLANGVTFTYSQHEVIAALREHAPKWGEIK